MEQIYKEAVGVAALKHQLRRISVYNAQGQFVNTEISVGQTQAKVDLKNLPAGIYFIELGSATAYERLKVIKE